MQSVLEFLFSREYKILYQVGQTFCFERIDRFFIIIRTFYKSVPEFLFYVFAELKKKNSEISVFRPMKETFYEWVRVVHYHLSEDCCKALNIKYGNLVFSFLIYLLVLLIPPTYMVIEQSFLNECHNAKVNSAPFYSSALLKLIESMENYGYTTFKGKF